MPISSVTWGWVAAIAAVGFAAALMVAIALWLVALARLGPLGLDSFTSLLPKPTGDTPAARAWAKRLNWAFGICAAWLSLLAFCVVMLRFVH